MFKLNILNPPHPHPHPRNIYVHCISMKFFVPSSTSIKLSFKEEGCTYQTYNRKSWFGHKSFVHQPERSICDLCGKSLKSEASLKQHKHLVHVIALSKEYPCDSCDKIFRSVCGLQVPSLVVVWLFRILCLQEILSTKPKCYLKAQPHTAMLHTHDGMY